MTQVKSFKVEGIELKTENLDSTNPEIQKVRIETSDAPEGFVTISPRKIKEIEKQVDGFKVDGGIETEPYRLEELPEIFKNIRDGLDKGKQFEIKGEFDIYDQREDEETDGDKVYYYINDQEAIDNLKLIEA